MQKTAAPISDKAVSGRYSGWRGNLRLIQVTQVIVSLGLYIYLDQYDLHRAQHLKRANAKLDTARRLGFLAILGQHLHRLKILTILFLLKLLRLFVVGREGNREKVQESRAEWLKSSLIQIGRAHV